MALPQPWLEHFISSELRAIVEWKQAIQSTADFRTAHDPNGRLNDDGSNFYSTTNNDEAKDARATQIVKVFSTDPVVLALSDGITSIRAKLSDEAVQAIETEIEDEFTEQTVGDVISLFNFTLVTTNLGPPDGFVRLDVRQLQYRYHLRKIPKDLIQIENYDKVRQSIITHFSFLRKRQFALEQGTQDEPLDVEDHVSLGAEDGGQIVSQGQSQTIATKSSQPWKRRGPDLSHDGFEIENGVNLERPRGANFDSPICLPKSNREQEKTAGLLQLLRKRNVRGASDVLPARSSPLPSSSPTPAQASNKRKAEEPSIEDQSHSQPPPKSPRIELVTTEAGGRSPSPHRIEDAGSQTKRSSALPDDRLPADPLPNDAIPDAILSLATVSEIRSTTVVPDMIKRYRSHHIPKDQQKLLDKQSSWLPSLPGEQSPHPNVPVGLLKKWNERAMRTKQQAPTTSVRSSQRPLQYLLPRSTSGKDRNGGKSGTDNPSSSSRSNSDDGDNDGTDEICIPWSPSPPAAPDLPPDSTMNSNTHSLPSSGRVLRHRPELEQPSVPRHSQESIAVKHSLHRSQSDGESQSRIGSGTLESPRGDLANVQRIPRKREPVTEWTTGEDEILIQRVREGRTSMEIVIDDLQHRTPATIRNRKRVLLDAYGDDVFTQGYGSQRASRRSPVVEVPAGELPNRTTLSQRIAPSQRNVLWGKDTPTPRAASKNNVSARRSQSSSRSTSLLRVIDDNSAYALGVLSDVRTTRQEHQGAHHPQASDYSRLNEMQTGIVVRITQPGENTAERDPQAECKNTQDPAIDYRLRRREHFSQSKMIRWLRENYVPVPESLPSFTNIYKAFKSAFPHDVVKLSALSETIEKAFPEHRGKGLRLKHQYQEGPASPNLSTTASIKAVEEPKEVTQQDRQHIHKLRSDNDRVSLSRSGQERDEQRSAMSINASRSAIPETVKEVTPPSLPWAIENRSRLASSALPSPTHFVVGARAETSRHHTSVNTAISTTEKTSRTLEERRRGPGRVERRPSTHFADFAKAFKQLRPGGAFAAPGELRRMSADSQLRVERWEL